MQALVQLDADVQQLLQSAMAREGASLDEVLNEALRSALAGGEQKSPRVPFKVRAKAMGTPRVEIGSFHKLLDELDSAEWLEQQKAKGG